MDEKRQLVRHLLYGVCVLKGDMIKKRMQTSKKISLFE
jgi:hypothetical protein